VTGITRMAKSDIVSRVQFKNGQCRGPTPAPIPVVLMDHECARVLRAKKFLAGAVCAASRACICFLMTSRAAGPCGYTLECLGMFSSHPGFNVTCIHSSCGMLAKPLSVNTAAYSSTNSYSCLANSGSLDLSRGAKSLVCRHDSA
jgi:hypothetical protein